MILTYEVFLVYLNTALNKNCTKPVKFTGNIRKQLLNTILAITSVLMSSISIWFIGFVALGKQDHNILPSTVCFLQKHTINRRTTAVIIPS
jgi:hypothetical protein